MSFRCKLGHHDYRYVGFQWRQANPWTKTGYSHECTRCGKTIYWASGVYQAKERPS